MLHLAPPTYVVEYTSKTVDAILSPAALNGQEIQLDVYKREDVTKKYQASGQRLANNMDLFRVTVTVDGVDHSHEWNYTILRESADRNRKQKR